MQAQGQAAIDLQEFDKSDQMAMIRNELRIASNTGAMTAFVENEKLGSTRDAIFTVTLLRQHGYEVKFLVEGIEVKW